MASTCSAAWPQIIADGDENEVVADVAVTHLIKANRQKDAVCFDEDPDAFKKDPDHNRNMRYARLFAAAPDLLDALREAGEALTTHPTLGMGKAVFIFSKIEAAIAKAEGRTK